MISDSSHQPSARHLPKRHGRSHHIRGRPRTVQTRPVRVNLQAPPPLPWSLRQKRRHMFPRMRLSLVIIMMMMTTVVVVVQGTAHNPEPHYPVS